MMALPISSLSAFRATTLSSDSEHGHSLCQHRAPNSIRATGQTVDNLVERLLLAGLVRKVLVPILVPAVAAVASSSSSATGAVRVSSVVVRVARHALRLKA